VRRRELLRVRNGERFAVLAGPLNPFRKTAEAQTSVQPASEGCDPA
jgi:hypothetical protein